MCREKCCCYYYSRVLNWMLKSVKKLYRAHSITCEPGSLKEYNNKFSLRFMLFGLRASPYCCNFSPKRLTIFSFFETFLKTIQLFQQFNLIHLTRRGGGVVIVPVAILNLNNVFFFSKRPENLGLFLKSIRCGRLVFIDSDITMATNF